MLTSKSSKGIVKFLYPVRSVQIGVTIHDSSAEYWKEHLMATESFCFKMMFSESVNSGSIEQLLLSPFNFQISYNNIGPYKLMKIICHNIYSLTTMIFVTVISIIFSQQIYIPAASNWI